MGWRDLGLIFRVHGQRPWMCSHGYVPSALLLRDRIRVFAAFWDAELVGRIGYVDIALHEPTQVIGFALEPVLDVGLPGTFDEHGVTPMAVQRVGHEVWLYYAGWQRSPTVRYLLFMGLAISSDDGLSFRRHSNVPVLERSDTHHLVRTGFVLHEHGRWEAWAAQSNGIVEINGKLTPSYELGYLESEDGIHWPASSAACLTTRAGGIFGYGRSAVWRAEGRYYGLFSVRRYAMGYRIEYATSADGRDWEPLRSDGMAFLPQHTVPAQRETMFPSLIRASNQLLMFYNGDSFGQEGIRCAAWKCSA
jgi:hypothetical protein